MQEPGNGHTSMACLKNNEPSVLNSIDFCLHDSFCPNCIVFLFNTGTYLATPATLHYKIFDMICFSICVLFSSALTVTVKHFLAWEERRVPVRVMKPSQRRASDVGNPFKFLTRKSIS